MTSPPNNPIFSANDFATFGEAIIAGLDGVIVFEQTGRVVYCGGRLFTFAVEQLRDILGGEELIEIISQWLVSHWDQELDLYRGECEVGGVPIELRCSQVGALGVAHIRDLTEERRVQRAHQVVRTRLDEAQKLEAFGAISGGMAHDFNNILASILGYLELCLEDAPPNSVLHRNLLEIQKASNRARSLVDQVLAAGRGEAREKLYVPVQMGLLEVVSLLKVRIDPRIQLTHSLPNDLMVILADPSDLHQIILNICNNSREAVLGKILNGALPDGGRIHLELRSVVQGELPEGLRTAVRSAERYVELKISDNGPGIPPEHLAKIFDPFFSTKEGNSGIGLASVKRILRGLGGALTIESEIGTGTTSSIYLPLIDLGSDIGAGSKVLVVDDEEALLGMVQQVLERLGFSVITARSGTEGLVQLERFPNVNAIVTDLMMPGMSGEDFLRVARSNGVSAPVFVCTALPESLTIEKQNELGIQAILEKPLNLPELALLLRPLLGEG